MGVVTTEQQKVILEQVKDYIDSKGGENSAASGDIDTIMSITSENAVQNKVIKEYVDTHTGIDIGYNEDNQEIILTSTPTREYKELPFRLAIDNDGNYGYIKAGADTVTPFKTGGDLPFYYWGAYQKNGSTGVVTSEYICETSGFAIALFMSSCANYGGNGSNPIITFESDGEEVSESFEDNNNSGGWGYHIHAKVYKIKKDDRVYITGRCPSGNSYVGVFSGIFIVTGIDCKNAKVTYTSKTTNTATLTYTHQPDENDKFAISISATSGGNVSAGAPVMSSSHEGLVIFPSYSLNIGLSSYGTGYLRARMYKLPSDEIFTCSERGSSGSNTWNGHIVVVFNKN